MFLGRPLRVSTSKSAKNINRVSVSGVFTGLDDYQHYLEAAVGSIDLSGYSLDIAEEDSLAVCERVHGLLSDVEPVSGVIDGSEED